MSHFFEDNSPQPYVSIAMENYFDPQPKKAASDEEDDEDKRTLFVSNLDERVTEEILYEVFLQAGPIESVRIPKEKNGRQRTFGFVTFAHACTPPYAMKLLEGLMLYKKKVNIKQNARSNINQNNNQWQGAVVQNSQSNPFSAPNSNANLLNPFVANPFAQPQPAWMLVNSPQYHSNQPVFMPPMNLHFGQKQNPFQSDLHQYERDRKRQDEPRRHQHHGNSRRSDQRRSYRN